MLFAPQTHMVEKESKIQSVNMMLHASVSMDTYLTDVSKYLNKDDILFIIHDYDYYCTEWKKLDSQNMEFSILYSRNICICFFLLLTLFPI